MMKKNTVSFSTSGNSNPKTKKRNINIKPIYELAKFASLRTPINPSRVFELCLFDLLPPNIKLTANELKVLIVLRSMVVGHSNLAAIDQEQISITTGVQQPNVARAIAGLRKKGIILQTWMEEGSQRYRNIYALWTPAKKAENDAKKMLSQQRKVKKLETQANKCDPKFSNKAEKLRKKVQQEKEKICINCKGDGWSDVYLKGLDKDSGILCGCSLGYHLSKQYSLSVNEFIPDYVLEKLPKKNKSQFTA
jgi:DNA-binding PadR family transcriptional regulator